MPSAAVPAALRNGRWLRLPVPTIGASIPTCFAARTKDAPSGGAEVFSRTTSGLALRMLVAAAVRSMALSGALTAATISASVPSVCSRANFMPASPYASSW